MEFLMRTLHESKRWLLALPRERSYLTVRITELNRNKVNLVDFVVRLSPGTDRRGLMPQAFGVLSQIPPENPAGLRINNHLIRLLYQTIPHPVDTLLGEDRFRQADGSRNNIFIPSLGQAGMPYARTCQGRHPLPIPSLPDAGLVFDGLLKATGVSAFSRILLTI
jgi:hypothetical protein